MWVQVPPLAQQQIKALAYIVGVALGDGNLSNPNGRAQRLRITCDTKYPKLINTIQKSIKIILPLNKVSLVHKKTRCLDISCYSNKWELFLGWKCKNGSKYNQNVKIPAWIKNNVIYSKECLRGLIQTDGSIYKDRGYIMVNYVTTINNLASDVVTLIKKLGFTPTIYHGIDKYHTKVRYTIRVSKSVDQFIKLIKLWKS